MTTSEWFLDKNGRIDRSCPHNVRMAINSLPDGYERLSILSRTKNTMRALADEIDRHHRYRPTLKATWEAVGDIRDQVFRVAQGVDSHLLDKTMLWICQMPDCKGPLPDGTRRLLFVQGSFICRDCSPYDEIRKGPLTLFSVLHEMRIRGMLE